MNTWMEKGPGRKKCPGAGCVVYVPVRTNGCPECGYDFAKDRAERKREERARRPSPMGEVSSLEATEADPSVSSDRRPLLITPAGRCPVELSSTNIVDVHDWARAVMAADPAHLYSLDALKYFARQFFDYASPEHKRVCAHLDMLQAQH